MIPREGKMRGSLEGQAGVARPSAKLLVTTLPQFPIQWAKHSGDRVLFL